MRRSGLPTAQTHTYVGETKQSLKARLGQHRRPSSTDWQPDSAIYTHAKTSGHQIDTEDVTILDREERWFERGVREAIWERVEKPSLNKRGGLRFQLSHAWDSSIINIPCRLTRDQSLIKINTGASLQLPDEVQ